jgi:hypothetical protein
MFNSSSKLPITEIDRQWVDDGFRRREQMLGRRRMIDVQVVLPTPQFFSNPYNETPESADLLFQRVCSYMQVERRAVELEIFSDATDELRELLPYWPGGSGVYARRRNE